MKISKLFLLSLLIINLLSCQEKPEANSLLYESETLKIKQLSEHSFVHISYLDIPKYGPFPCNGLIYVQNDQAVVFDTPTDTTVSYELIDWIEAELNAKVQAVVINHFHVDCLGGLVAFHQRGIPSYANEQTIELAQKDSVVYPQNGFNQVHELALGEAKIINQHFGEGHTKDNIVSFLPEEGVLFGGCMIKSLKAGKGNLKDANIHEWANTVAKVKTAFPQIKQVVPGHGAVGGIDLLDYTIDMFQQK